jgi:MoaA/NifB/PqqE/SkfB family radical SAM enzyme
MLSSLSRAVSSIFRRGAPNAFSALSRIDHELRLCRSAREAISFLEGIKANLCLCLRARFASPLPEALTLKILNLFLARYHFQARTSAVASRPIGLVVDPANGCQLACPGCVHSARNEAGQLFDWPAGTLPGERLSALLKCHGPHAIDAYFCNYGEPLLNPHTPALIRLAKSHLLGTGLSTNLNARHFDADAYVEAGLDFMSLSIDGATQPVYERFRRNGDLALVFANLRKLVQARRARRRRTPVLSWHFLAFEHNVQEIPLALDLACKLGVDQFRVINPFDVAWDDPDIHPAPIPASVHVLDQRSLSAIRLRDWNRVPERVDADAILRAFESPWPELPDDASPSGTRAGSTCPWLYTNTVMDATGRIMPCCGPPRPDHHLVFGQVDHQAGGIFNTLQYRQARAWFAGCGALAADAPYCARCQYSHDTVTIGGAEIRRYFRNADVTFFDRRSLDLLSNWCAGPPRIC